MNRIILFSLINFSVLLIAGCSTDEQESVENQVSEIPQIELPEYPVSDLPEGLVWETNETDPVYADPDATKGGTYQEFMMSFPLTLRVVGPDSNSSFAHYTRNIKMGLTDLHPNTENHLPSLATHWAYGADNKTVYFKLNPDARWSDGEPITADDFIFALEFHRSEYIVAPWYNNYYSTELESVKKYDDHTISVTGGTVKPKEDLMLYYGISPVPRHFHKLDENWVRDYNWKIAPTAGPYVISRVEKGKYVELKRKEDWWAANLKYFKHRYNVDTIRVSVIRDLETAYRHFLRGELDTIPITSPNYWYDKTDDDNYKSGYINRIWFYNDIPQPTTGMSLNMDHPILSDINVRYGIAHAMNFEKMISNVLRGDYVRKHTYSSGYGKYTNNEIRAREFNLDKAESYFELAGWSERGPDGFRVKDGAKLSLVMTYSSALHTDRLSFLREEAKKAGVDLQLRLLDPAAAYKNQIEKKHQIAWGAWGTSLRPQYYGGYHSDNAHKPQTNNITNTDDPEMDDLIMGYRDSRETDERAELARQIQQKIHDIGAYIPAYDVPYVRHAYWRWVMLPEHIGTRLSDSLFDAVGLGLFWLDQKEKARTEQAMSNNETFEPVIIIDDQFKTTK